MNRNQPRYLTRLVLGTVFASAAALSTLPLRGEATRVSGELAVWRPITVDIFGPPSDEQADPNPFLDYRVSVEFVSGDRVRTIPAYYAADGRAAESHPHRATFGERTSFRRFPVIGIIESTLERDHTLQFNRTQSPAKVWI
jgi:hypothetical protein